MIKLFKNVFLIHVFLLGALFTNAQDIQPIISSGFEYLAENEFTLANDQFNLALGIEEYNAQALLGKARSYLGLKDHNEAIRQLEFAISNNDSVPDVLLELGKIHFKFANYKEASNAFSEGLITAPNNPHLNYYYGASLFYEDNLVLSNTHLNKAVNLGEFNGYVHYYLGEIALSKDSFDLAHQEVDIAIKNNSYVPRFHLSKGDIFYAQEEYLWASIHYTNALEMNPDYMNARKARARSYMESEKYILALSDLRKIVKSEPKLSDAWSDKGTSEYALQKYDDAIESYTTAFNLESDYSLINKRALAYQEKGDFESAIKDLRVLSYTFPNDAAIHFRLANVYQLNSQYQAALEEYEACLEIDGNDVLAWNNKAVVLYNLNKIEHACHIWDEIITKSQDPDYVKMAQENKESFCK